MSQISNTSPAAAELVARWRANYRPTVVEADNDDDVGVVTDTTPPESNPFASPDAFPPARDFYYATSEHGMASNRWTQLEGLDGYLRKVSEHKVQEYKDANAVFPGLAHSAEGGIGPRKESQVQTVDAVNIDLDSATQEEVDRILAGFDAANIKYVAHTTYTHLLGQKELTLDKFVQRGKEIGVPVQPITRENWDKIAQTFDDATGVVEPMWGKSKDGTYTVQLRVPAVVKWRIVLFLDAPYTVAGLMTTFGWTEKDVRTRVWKASLSKLCKAFGIKNDPSCFDLPRAYYRASCPPHMIDKAEVRVGTGTQCLSLLSILPTDEKELDALCPAAPRRTSKGKGVRVASRKTEGKIPKAWFSKYASTFAIEDALPEDVKRGVRSGGKPGSVIECPNEDEHSTPGGSGCYAVNGEDNDEHGFSIQCSHAHCKERFPFGAGTDRAAMLELMLDLGWITVEDLEKPALGGGPLSAARGIDSLTPDSTPDDIKDVLRGLAEEGVDGIALDQALRKIGDRVSMKGDARRALKKDFTEAKKALANEKAEARKAKTTEEELEPLPLTATALLMSACRSGGVEGEVIDRGRALKVGEYTVRDARLFGHEPVLVQGDRVCGDDEIRAFAATHGLTFDLLDLTETFAALAGFDVGVDYDSHVEMRAVRRIDPNDLARPNLVALEQTSQVVQDTTLMHIFRFNAEYAVVEIAGAQPVVLDRKTGGRTRPRDFGHKEVRYYHAVKGGAVKRVPLADEWLNSPWRVHYDGVGFYPLNKTVEGKDYRDDPTTARHFNEWTGYGVKPVQGDWSLLREHAREVICRGDEAKFDYLLKWHAYKVQKPYIKPRVAPVYIGEKQIGKSLWSFYYAALFGRHGTIIDKNDHVTGRFVNLSNICYAGLEEALYSGNHKEVNTTKHAITSERQRVENKFENAYDTTSCTAYGFTANSLKAVAVTPDEERFFVCQLSTKYKGNKAYFKAIRAQMANGGLEAMLYDLLHMDLGDWTPWDNLVYTDDFKEMVVRELEGADRGILLALRNGKIGDSKWSADVPLIIDAEKLYEALGEWMPHYGTRKADEMAAAEWLKESGLVNKVIRAAKNPKRYEIASRDKARLIMAEKWSLPPELLCEEGAGADPYDLAREYLTKIVSLTGIDLLESAGYSKLVKEIESAREGA